MADERKKRIDDSITTWQTFKAGFAGDATAQEKQRESYARSNEEELEAERRRKAMQEAMRKRTGQ